MQALIPVLLTLSSGALAQDSRPAQQRSEAPNTLSPLDQRAGWRLLFDGESTSGWTSYAAQTFPEHGWVIEQGCLRHVAGAGGGDIVTEEPFVDFELEFEWKLAAGSNSGVKYRVPRTTGKAHMLGPEYQILDSTRHATQPQHTAGAIYDLIAPEGARPAPLGSFNRARIVAHGKRLEHWLNGERLLAVEVDSAQWKAALTASKFAGDSDFGAPLRGHIGLQDHDGDVWFRNLRLRDWTRPAGRRVELFDTRTLAGWRVLGDASYSADEGSILGRTGAGGHSFLVSDESFSDFILELEVKTELPGNSGIQVRSHLNESGRVYGYQIEIDPSERAWSGGLYDEGRRGWLQSLEGNQAGRRAFRHGEWNHYRIECVGESIRVRVNGIRTVDYRDDADSEGFIGLQVHSGKDTRVRWRDLCLYDLSDPSSSARPTTR